MALWINRKFQDALISVLKSTLYISEVFKRFTAIEVSQHFRTVLLRPYILQENAGPAASGATSSEAISTWMLQPEIARRGLVMGLPHSAKLLNGGEKRDGAFRQVRMDGAVTCERHSGPCRLAALSNPTGVIKHRN